MNKDCEISIVIPAHNREDTLGRAIESALGQTSVRLEVVVVDDGSTDGTYGKATQYEGQGVRVIKMAQSSGGRPGLVRNKGVESARAPIILFLDSDDALRPGAARLLLEAFKGQEEIGVCWGYKALWREGKMESVAYVDRIANISSKQYPALFLAWTPGTGGLCFKKEVFEHIKGFDPSVGSFEDLDFTLRIATSGKWAFKNIHQVTYDCHIAGGISSSVSAEYLSGLEGFVEKHKELLAENPKVYTKHLYAMAISAYILKDLQKAKTYRDRLFNSAQVTAKHRLVFALYGLGLGKWVLWFQKKRQAVDEAKRLQKFREAA